MTPAISLWSSTMIPVRPSSITSGTAPWRVAITGVPHAMDSIITRPNGSAHSIGKSVDARVLEEVDLLVVRDLAEVFDVVAEVRLDGRVEVLLLASLLHLAGELQREPRSFATSTARWAPLSGLMRPMKSR